MPPGELLTPPVPDFVTVRLSVLWDVAEHASLE
jgi:hypothetical protein